MSEISDSLSRLRAVAPRLNQASDMLSTTVVQVEKALAELNLGVVADVWMSLPSDPELEEHGFEECEGISYRKQGDQWCICHIMGMVDNPPDWRITRLASAAREIRLKVVEHELLPKLLEELAKKAENKVEQVEAAAKSCEQIAMRLGGDPGKEPKPADNPSATKRRVIRF